jgi:hypothetical protein
VGREVDYQVAAPLKREHPTCTERQSLTKECGWKDGDRGGPAQTQNPLGGKRKTDLTLTGLLMEGLGQYIAIHPCLHRHAKQIWIHVYINGFFLDSPRRDEL